MIGIIIIRFIAHDITTEEEDAYSILMSDHVGYRTGHKENAYDL